MSSFGHALGKQPPCEAQCGVAGTAAGPQALAPGARPTAAHVEAREHEGKLETGASYPDVL